MSAPPTSAAPANPSDPHQDRPPVATDVPIRTARLFTVLRALIDYGRQLASALQQRTSTTNLADVTRNFGTIDIAQILACITRGLHRAAALEARLASRLPAAPPAPVAPPASATRSFPSRRQPPAAPPGDPTASATTPRLARLPTPGDIAAQVRRRPIGAVIADICRDLGIVPSHSLWRQISMVIIENGGNLATLYKDLNNRIFAPLLNPPAPEHPAQPAPYQPSAVTPGTGPP